MYLLRFKAIVWSPLFLAKEDCSHCVVCLQGLAKRVGARLLLASTSEVYGGRKDAFCSSVFSITKLSWLTVWIALDRTLNGCEVISCVNRNLFL